MPASVITLTTDFGPSDWYVAAMKGAALNVNPHVTIVDVSHDVPPQDIAHGAFVLGAIYRYYAPDTVHVGVVDPGVGTSRRALLLVTPNGRFLAPDNGLLTYVLADQLKGENATGRETGEFMAPVTTPVPERCSAYTLNRPEFWRHPVSDTFHGRDIFAPVAAHLASGVPPEELGDAVGYVVCLDIPPPKIRGETVAGRVIFVDHFGNIVSNIRPSILPNEAVEVEVCGARIKGLSRTFSSGEGLMTLIGSHGYLEVVESNGNAAERLKAGVGSWVKVRNPGTTTGQ